MTVLGTHSGTRLARPSRRIFTMKSNTLGYVTFGLVVTVLAYVTQQPAWLTATLATLTVVLAGITIIRKTLRYARYR